MNRPATKVRRPQLLCIIGCEGENQEKMYFEKIQSIVNSMEERVYDLLFDLWLILHKENYFNKVNNQDDYGRKLRRIYGLERGGKYKEKG